MRSPAPGHGAALLLLAASAALAGEKAGPPPLTAEHTHPTGAFTFMTPEGWTAGGVPGRPGQYQATDGTLLVRFVYQPQESGFDSLHATCMLERLAGSMETAPQVEYEYDFLSWEAGERRVLDSAFAVHYDQAQMGSKDWHQRNLTVVGAGESLCIITHAPLALWKKSKAVHALLDGIVKSVTFRSASPAAPARP